MARKSVLCRVRLPSRKKPPTPMTGYFQSTDADAEIWSVYKLPGLIFFDPMTRVIQVQGERRQLLGFGPEWREIPAPPGAPTGPVPAPVPEAGRIDDEPSNGDDVDHEAGPSLGRR